MSWWRNWRAIHIDYVTIGHTNYCNPVCSYWLMNVISNSTNRIVYVNVTMEVIINDRSIKVFVKIFWKIFIQYSTIVNMKPRLFFTVICLLFLVAIICGRSTKINRTYGTMNPYFNQTSSGFFRIVKVRKQKTEVSIFNLQYHHLYLMSGKWRTVAGTFYMDARWFE